MMERRALAGSDSANMDANMDHTRRRKAPALPAEARFFGDPALRSRASLSDSSKTRAFPRQSICAISTIMFV